MAAEKRRDDWHPNANEAQVMTGFNMGVTQVGTVGSLGWGGLRWLARRLGLPVAEPPPARTAPVAVACPRCGAPTSADEATCGGCGRATRPVRPTTAAQIAALSAAAEQRRRRDLALALVAGVVLGVGILLLAQSLERSMLQLMGLRLWWLAGLFWGVLVYVGRRWLDQ